MSPYRDNDRSKVVAKLMVTPSANLALFKKKLKRGSCEWPKRRRPNPGGDLQLPEPGKIG